MGFIKYFSLINYFIWDQTLNQLSPTYPKRKFNLLEELHASNIFGGFTYVYGDKNISADKRTQVILVNFFLSHS